MRTCNTKAMFNLTISGLQKVTDGKFLSFLAESSPLFFRLSLDRSRSLCTFFDRLVASIFVATYYVLTSASEALSTVYIVRTQNICGEKSSSESKRETEEIYILKIPSQVVEAYTHTASILTRYYY